MTEPASAQPLVVAYGMGVDSTAMLVEFARRGIGPDLILFADVGSEKPETYGYLPVIQDFLRRKGFPPVQVVRRSPTNGKNGYYETIEQQCLVNRTLPSLAFGYKKCSLTWKRSPQDKFCNHWEPARKAWAAGLKVCKAIGYDAGPKDARRSSIQDDAKYAYWYPLREWGWDRERCIEEVRREGLRVPVKSACFFCPASKPHEIEEIVRTDLDLADRICAIEAAAKPNLKKVEGLWRRATRARPGSMTEFIEAVRKATSTRLSPDIGP